MSDTPIQLKDTSAPWWIKVWKELGTSTAIIILMGYAIWQGSSWFATEIALPLFHRQMKFIDEVQSSVQAMADASAKTSAGQSEMATQMKANHEVLEDIKQLLEKSPTNKNGG